MADIPIEPLLLGLDTCSGNGDNGLAGVLYLP